MDNFCGCDLSFDMPREIARHAVVEDVPSELQRLGSPSIGRVDLPIYTSWKWQPILAKLWESQKIVGCFGWPMVGRPNASYSLNLYMSHVHPLHPSAIYLF